MIFTPFLIHILSKLAISIRYKVQISCHQSFAQFNQSNSYLDVNHPPSAINIPILSLIISFQSRKGSRTNISYSNKHNQVQISLFFTLRINLKFGHLKNNCQTHHSTFRVEFSQLNLPWLSTRIQYFTSSNERSPVCSNLIIPTLQINFKFSQSKRLPNRNRHSTRSKNSTTPRFKQTSNWNERNDRQSETK